MWAHHATEWPKEHTKWPTLNDFGFSGSGSSSFPRRKTRTAHSKKTLSLRDGYLDTDGRLANFTHSLAQYIAWFSF
jgi:hypothetical protein